MILMAGMELPLQAIREQIASAIDVVVHVSRLSDGSRRVTHVSEVTGMEGSIVQLNELFELKSSGETDEEGNLTDMAQPTGLRPSFASNLKSAVIDFSGDMFGDAAADGNGVKS